MTQCGYDRQWRHTASIQVKSESNTESNASSAKLATNTQANSTAVTRSTCTKVCLVAKEASGQESNGKNSKKRLYSGELGSLFVRRQLEHCFLFITTVT